MIGFKQNNPYHLYDVWEHTLHCMDDVAPDTDLITRLAIFLHDIGKPNNYVEDENGIGHFYGHAHSSYTIAQEVLKRLRYSNDIVESVSQLIDCHDVTLTPTKAAVKRLLNKLGEKQLRRLLVLRTHDIKGQSSKDIELRLEKVYKVSEILDWIVEQSECFQLKDLSINGKDLIESDFVCIKTNGDLMVRECLQRDRLTKPMNVKLLNASRNYWLKRGADWGLVVDAEV